MGFMPDREFLEKYPLYRKFRFQVPSTLDKMAKPAIHMHCELCKSGQTFNMINEYHENYEQGAILSEGKIVRACYRCTACNSYLRTFYLRFDEKREFVVKVGQFPPWNITPDAKTESMLGVHAEYYKKGLVCESQGYGIGSFAYYRRIVEEIIDTLLGEITDLLVGQEREKYLVALEESKKTTIAQEKIALVKDLLPPILRPNGMNPLAILHSILSEGIHTRSDEKCMEDSMAVREALVFLVNQVAASKTASKTFTTQMRKLLEKKRT